MINKECKIIKDPIHGYIEIGKLELSLIDTLQFQRLKDIRQLTSNHVFPSVNHTRFEHSLGVMHISKSCFKYLKEELFENKYLNESQYNVYLIHLSLASLLHDVGHTPLSHLGEKFLKRNDIKNEISRQISNKKLNIDEKIFDFENYSPHEIMSCYVILDSFYEIIKKYSPIEIDFELIFRCIIGYKYLHSDSDGWEKNILIRIINNSTIDADKLDYIMRDAYMSGINVPIIDLRRLLSGICIHKTTKKITFDFRALPVVQNILDIRDSLYLWVYNHHTVVYSDFLMEELIRELLKTPKDKENSNFFQLDYNTYFSCNAISKTGVSDSDMIGAIKQSYNSHFSVNDYGCILFKQLFKREFLKPLWKNIYGFKTFFQEMIKDADLADAFINDICKKEGFRENIVSRIESKLNVEKGSFFIIPRSNKFYSLKIENKFKIYDSKEGFHIDLDRILPQKDYKSIYKDVAFYVYYKKDIDEVKIKEAIVDEINNSAIDLDY